METILTADHILQISPLDYKEALTVLKYCDFNTVRRKRTNCMIGRGVNGSDEAFREVGDRLPTKARLNLPYLPHLECRQNQAERLI